MNLNMIFIDQFSVVTTDSVPGWPSPAQLSAMHESYNSEYFFSLFNVFTTDSDISDSKLNAFSLDMALFLCIK